MYAITENGYRAVTDPADALPGETVVEILPAAFLQSLAQAAANKVATADTLRTRSDQALTDLRAYRDLASPTNAQTIAAVKLLCRVAIGLTRLSLSKLDGTD